MIMECMQASCTGRKEGREATLLVCYPSGERCPSCDECARYWLGLRPDATWIEPLSSWVDPLGAAKAQMAEAPAAIRAPGPSAPPAARAPAGQATSPSRDLLRAAVRGEVVASVPGQPTSHDVPRQLSRNEKKAIAWLSVIGTSIVTGIVLAVAGSHQTRLGPVTWSQGIPYAQPENNPGLMVLGIALIVIPLLAGVIWVISSVTKHASQAHQGWISQYAPEQQARIRKTERAAVWGALAVADVAPARAQQAHQGEASRPVPGEDGGLPGPQRGLRCSAAPPGAARRHAAAGPAGRAAAVWRPQRPPRQHVAARSSGPLVSGLMACPDAYGQLIVSAGDPCSVNRLAGRGCCCRRRSSARCG